MQKMFDDIAKATTKEELEEKFLKYNITSAAERIYTLKKVMGVKKTHPDKVGEFGYDVILAKFFEGTWRQF